MAHFPQNRAQDRLNHYLVSDHTASSNISSLTVMLTVVYLAFCDKTVQLQHSILMTDLIFILRLTCVELGLQDGLTSLIAFGL
jgi:hypothetical protein